MTDLNFLSSCDKLRKEELSTRRGYKPRRCCKSNYQSTLTHLSKSRNDDLSYELADKLRREVSTSMLYRWFKNNKKEVLRT